MNLLCSNEAGVGSLRSSCLLGLALLAALLSGCASSVKMAATSNSFEMREEVIASSADEYRLQVGDKISIVCVINEKLGAENTYYITAGDVIGVAAQERADLSSQYKVNPDGSVQFIQLGVMQVAGLSLSELRAKLEQGYREKMVKDPISIGLVAYNTALDNFISKLSPGGIGREPFATVIAVDGNANFPLIGFVKLNDLTLQEANALVASKYREHFKSIDVTLRIESSPGHNVAVLGEVLRPGAFGVNGTLSVLSALGSAGGYTPNAKLDSIMIVQRRGNKVYVNKFDLEDDMFAMANLKLIAGDFVFVPKSTIANVNTFIDQYLRRTLPFNLNASGNFEIK